MILILSFIRTIRFVEKKTVYSEDLFKYLFKNQIKGTDINDFGLFNETDFYFHLTDAESTISILCDRMIYPYAMKTEPERFGSKKNVYLFDNIITNESDMHFTRLLFDYKFEI